MKKTHFLAVITAIGFLATLPLGLVACSNDDDDSDSTATNKTDDELALEEAAFSVLHSLADRRMAASFLRNAQIKMSLSNIKLSPPSHVAHNLVNGSSVVVFCPRVRHFVNKANRFLSGF